MFDSSFSSPVALAIGVSVIAAFYMLTSSKDDRIVVEGTLKCPCGKVTGKFKAPRSTPSGACHCNDCVGFVKRGRDKKYSLDVSSFYSVCVWLIDFVFSCVITVVRLR
jgi:hypothetical protein